MMKLFENFQKKRLIFYKRWLEYIPNEWNIDEILEKKVKDLTDLEIDRLQEIRIDRKYVSIIDDFIKRIDDKVKGYVNEDSIVCLSIDSSELDEYNKIIDYFDFDTIALSKLSDSELAFVNKITCNYDYDSAISEIDNLDNEYVKEYAEYLLNRKSSRKFHRELEKHYEELAKTRRLGCNRGRWLYSIKK